MKKLIFAFALFFGITKGFSQITLTPTTLINGYVGHPYSESLTSSGGNTPFTYTVTGSGLPTGLTITTGGGRNAKISGTPTTAGVYSFSVTATDRNGSSDINAYSVTITYNYLTLSQLQTVWTRATPTGPDIYDSWNSVYPYLTYTALITQASTAAPTATELKTDFDLTYTRVAAGTYSVIATGGIFESTRTWFYIATVGAGNTASITWQNRNGLLLSTNADDVLTRAPIEIRIYKSNQ